MKAFGGVEPLQYVSLRQFQGLDANKTFEPGNSHLLGGIGLDVNEFPFIKTRRNFKLKFNSPKVNASTNPVTMASYNNIMYVAYDKSVKNENNVSIFTLSNTELVSFTKFKGNLASTHLIFSNGTDLKKFDGTTVSNLLPGGYPVTVNGFFITTHQNRLFCTSNRTTTLLFSALNKADDWATANDAGSIQIDELTDNSITAIYSVNDRLLIFRENAIFELLGTGPSNFRIVQVAKGIGAINNRSVVAIDGTVYFVHFSGVYAYNSGSNPVLISNPINKYFYLDQFYAPTFASFQSRANLGTDSNYLYFNAPQVNGSPYNVTYQYDVKTNQWIGFLEKNVQGMVISDRQVYFSTINYYSGDLDVYYIVPQSKGSSPYGTLPDINWYFWTPIINTQTTEGNVLIRSLQLRFQSYGSFSIYLMDHGTTNSYNSFDAQTTFPNDVTLTSIKSSGRLLYSFSGTGFKNVRVPVYPYPKNKSISLLFVGTNEFRLDEAALEVIQTPINTNTNI